MTAQNKKPTPPAVAPKPLEWRAQVELLDEMSRMAKVGGWEFDPATGQGSCTDEVARIHDLDPSQPVNMQLSLDCYPGASRTRLEQALKEAVELGKPYDLELAFRSTKGLLKWVRTIGRPVMEGGRVVKVWGTLQDITERKRMEDELRTSEEKFAKAFRSNPDAIVLTELETGRFVEVNEGFEKLSGYTRAEVVGYTVLDFPVVTPEERERFATLLREQGQIRNAEFIHRNKAGQDRLVLLSAELLTIDGKQHALTTLHDITARREAEAALRESEARFRQLFEYSPDAIFVEDAEGLVLDVNLAACRLHALPREELIGKKVVDLVPQDQRDLVSRQFPKWFSGELTHYAGMTHTAKSEDIAVDISGARIQYGGRPAVLLHVRDITDQKRAEATLREREEHYRLLADNAEDFVFLNDTEGHRLYVSPSYYRVTGWPPDQSSDADWSARLHPDDLPLIERTRAANLAGKPSIITHRVLCRNGDWLWVESQCKPARGPDGKVAHLLLWVRDITRRKQAEEESRHLTAAVEQAAESIFITDTAGLIQYTNPAFERISGYPSIEVIGQNPRLFKSGSHDATFYRQMWEPLKRGEVWTGHMINRHKDGTLYETEASIAPVRNPAGQVTNYVSIERDVTEMVRLQQQLQQAQKMETVGQLAGGVAHDFNNILQTILGYSELLIKNTPETDERRHDLLEIQRSGERAATLTRQLLAFSRKQMLMARVLDLNDIVTNLAKMLSRLIGENVHLKLDLVAGLLNVKVDSGQMDQVLINLAINARDAMPKGGQLLLRTTNVKLSAEDLPLHPEGRAGHFVCLSITDNGTGMSREVQAHIFEPFFTTKEQGKGTGLGLSTVYGIIKQHDGWITVYSEPGLGTTFRVYLPALDDTSVVAPAAAVEIPPPTAHGERILIIEDDALVRRMAQQMLTRHGYRAVAVGSCAEALSAYNNLFALVLCDVILPDGNGLDLARQLQKQRPDLRCVLTSGYADIHERWPEIEQNRWPFLIKPFNQLDLLRAIATALVRADIFQA